MAGKLAVNGGKPVVSPDMIKPWPWITEEDKRAIMQALEESTPWRYPFPQVTALEEEWAAYTGMKYCLATNSGTASLHLAVAAAEVGPGDEVIVPALTFLASASCVLHSNGIPIFVDVDYETITIDPNLIEEKITEKTKAIVAVDLHGIPADYDAIRAIARKHNLLVIEDGAQAQGARYKGKPVGGLGDMAGCSLNGSKNLSALGEGGVFTTNDEKQFELAKRVRMFGELVKPGQPREYNAYIMGWNYRMDNLQAAFARSQLKRLDEMNAARIKNCEYLTEHLKDLPGVEPPTTPPDRTNVYFFYVFRVRPEHLDLDVPVPKFRDALERALQAEGVPARKWQRAPVPGQSLFRFRDGYGKGCPWSCPHARKDIEYRNEDYPNTLRVLDEMLVIGHSTGGIAPPNGTELMSRYVDAFHKVLVECRDELIGLVQDYCR